MDTTVISTKNAPDAIGPYSQAIKAGGFVFVSGCLPIDMSTGVLSDSGIDEQTRHALRNLSAILEAAGSGLGKVVRTTVFVKDLKDFQTINQTYSEFFVHNAPSRSCVQVAALPKDAQVEIDAIALA